MIEMKSKLQVIIGFILAAFLWVLVSGTLAALPPRKNLQVVLQDKRISDLSPSGLTLSFIASVENVSEKKFYLVSYRYQVLINEREYVRPEVSLEEPIDILPARKTTLNFPVKIDYEYITPLLAANQKQATCRVSGEISFQDERQNTEKIPFNFFMNFPIFKLPQVDFLPLLVKDLTLGGAEFNFRFRISNENPYDLLIQKLRLELMLEGRSIFRGEIAGDNTLGSAENKVISLPLILDFFELGREVRDSLEKESTPFTLRATFEADSAWGWLTFSVEKKDSVKKEFNR